MTFNKIKFFVFLACFFNVFLLWAQPTEKRVKILVAPDHANWVYKLGEPARFQVTVLKNNNPITNIQIRYEIGHEMMDPVVTDSIVLNENKFVIDGGSMEEAGFLRCKVTTEVDGNRYEGLATASFAPEQIIHALRNEALPEPTVIFYNRCSAMTR